MGCIKSKNHILPDECFCDLTYTLPRKRAYSFDITRFTRTPRCNDNKLSQLKYLSSSLQMEAELLEDLNKRMPRYSTVNCDLSLSGEQDEKDDAALNYADFKMNLITYQPLKLQFVDGIPEAISGQTTPHGFPGYTKNCGLLKKAPVYATVNKCLKKRGRGFNREVLRKQVKVYGLPELCSVETVAMRYYNDR